MVEIVASAVFSGIVSGGVTLIILKNDMKWVLRAVEKLEARLTKLEEKIYDVAY